jgi:hypothetical protein
LGDAPTMAIVFVELRTLRMKPSWYVMDGSEDVDVDDDDEEK